MIADCFTFFNELDILKIRLVELYPVVDRFVLVENNKTFRGHDKPYFFEENKGFYDEFLDKIIHIKLEDPGQFNSDHRRDPWEREYWQRNSISLGIKDLEDEDIIIVSDVDEIPRRSVISKLDPQPIQRLNMRAYYYGLNVYGGGEGASKATRKKFFTTAQEIRATDPPEIEDAGWHFSYLGDAEHISNKFKAFSHWELDIPTITSVSNIYDRMSRGVDLWGREEKHQIVEIDDTWPEEVKNNLEYYKKYIRS